MDASSQRIPKLTVKVPHCTLHTAHPQALALVVTNHEEAWMTTHDYHNWLFINSFVVTSLHSEIYTNICYMYSY